MDVITENQIHVYSKKMLEKQKKNVRKYERKKNYQNEFLIMTGIPNKNVHPRK